MAWSQLDCQMMELALELARSQVGRTGSNPSVGCVIANGAIIVAKGVTADGGRPHGEEAALCNAKSPLQGATAYVTLEPCAHSSLRGPTCASSLAASGIARLVCCCEDPDPRTSGRGFDRLRSSGILVEIGLYREEGLTVIKDFIAVLKPL